MSGAPLRHRSRDDDIARCEAILRAWLDDPLTRLSLESGADGDVHSLARSLVSVLGKSAPDRLESKGREPMSATKVIAKDDVGRPAIILFEDRSFVHGSLLDRERAELNKAKSLIQEYMDYCSSPGEWGGDPVLMRLRQRMLEFLSGSPEA